MKLKPYVRWLLPPLALIIGFVPLVLRERQGRLQSRMLGLWRYEKTGETIQIAPPDGDNLLPVTRNPGRYGSRLGFFEIVDADHVRIVDGLGRRDLARVSITPSGRSMIVNRQNYPQDYPTKYIRIK